jgi:hypothetical protein
VGAVEVLKGGEEAPATTDALASVLDGGRPDEKGGSEQNERESDFQVDGGPEKEAAEDGWWDLEVEWPDHEDAEVNSLQAEPPHCPLYGASRSDHSTAGREQRASKRQGATADQQWEEARQNARLRQMLSSGSSSEDEDVEQHGRWTLEFYEPP